MRAAQRYQRPSSKQPRRCCWPSTLPPMTPTSLARTSSGTTRAGVPLSTPGPRNRRRKPGRSASHRSRTTTPPQPRSTSSATRTVSRRCSCEIQSATSSAATCVAIPFLLCTFAVVFRRCQGSRDARASNHVVEAIVDYRLCMRISDSTCPATRAVCPLLFRARRRPDRGT